MKRVFCGSLGRKVRIDLASIVSTLQIDMVSPESNMRSKKKESILLQGGGEGGLTYLNGSEIISTYDRESLSLQNNGPDRHTVQDYITEM